MATTTEPASGARARARSSEDDAPRGDASDDGRAAATEGATDDATTRDASDDDDEEETCGFCKYMKGGSCRAAFVAWEACVDAAKARDEDFVETCFETTAALRDCMLRDPEYYGPMVGRRGRGRRGVEGGAGGGGRRRGRTRRDGMGERAARRDF